MALHTKIISEEMKSVPHYQIHTPCSNIPEMSFITILHLNPGSHTKSHTAFSCHVSLLLLNLEESSCLLLSF